MSQEYGDPRLRGATPPDTNPLAVYVGPPIGYSELNSLVISNGTADAVDATVTWTEPGESPISILSGISIPAGNVLVLDLEGEFVIPADYTVSVQSSVGGALDFSLSFRYYWRAVARGGD